MNKPKFKCFMSALCAALGILLISFAFLITAFSYTTYTLLLALGSSLIAIGGIAYYIYYQKVKLIQKLKHNKLPIFARWTYNPLQIESIHNSLIEEKHSSLSITILSTLLCLILDMGFILSNPQDYLLFSILLGIAIILFCLIVCIGIHFYYHTKLTHAVEAIISDQYIYFSGELYGLNRSLYSLERVTVAEGTPSYLQFIYGTPGTPYDPIEIVTLPIPLEEMHTAHTIKEHFLKLIASHSNE